MSLLFVVIFSLVRFILAWKEGFGISQEAIAAVIVAALVVVVTITYLAGKLRAAFSFSFDVLVVTIIGYFLWELKGNANYLLWLTLAAFAVLTITSVIIAIKLFKKDNPSTLDLEEMVDLHGFINKALMVKFAIVVGGVLLVEKLFMPILVG